MDTDRPDELPFENRGAAGAALARRLAGVHWQAPAIVLALPRGGVPVAKAVASALHLPLDVLVVRKIRHPHEPEFAIGAVAAGGVIVRNDDLDESIPSERFAALAAEQCKEVERREIRYRPGRAPLSLVGRTAILVDDGLATGATMRAALTAARAMGAVQLVAAVPVGSREAAEDVAHHADKMVCLCFPEPFEAVSLYYAEFSQLDDLDVRNVLGEAA